MDGVISRDFAMSTVRDDFIPKEHYVSRAFAALEKAKLWPKVWQVAGREEELPRPGNFITYDVSDQSIIVVRAKSGEIKAFHNVCPHRGNQLTSGCGSVTKFYCSFHGWQWNLDGENIFIKDPEDWAQCSGMAAEDLGLSAVHVATWGGFIFINMAEEPESFDDFIAPVREILDCVEFNKMRFSWYKTMRLKGNWKTAMESFMESYHVYTTHGQLVSVLDEISVSTVHGKHGKHGYPTARPPGAPSARTGQPVPADMRPNYAKLVADLLIQTGAGTSPNKVGNVSERSANAVKRLMEECPAEAAPWDVVFTALRFMEEAAIAEGAGWPKATPEQMAQLGVDWNIFPNLALVFALDSSLVFRARPDGEDPDACIFDMWGIVRTAPDKPPVYDREFYEDWHANNEKIPHLLVQDLTNIEKIQRGMHSAGFRGSRTNPVQESQISNHHRVLRTYLDAAKG